MRPARRGGRDHARRRRVRRRDVTGTLREAHEQLREAIGARSARRGPGRGSVRHETGDAVVTAVDAARLRTLNDQLLPRPTGFTVNAKLRSSSSAAARRSSRAGSTGDRRRRSPTRSLLEDGIPIRLSGQDTERGTFAHRHLMLHDPYTGETYAPIQYLPGANASFEVYNSPLSEYAAVGFEYGYSVAAPDALVSGRRSSATSSTAPRS